MKPFVQWLNVTKLTSEPEAISRGALALLGQLIAMELNHLHKDEAQAGADWAMVETSMHTKQKERDKATVAETKRGGFRGRRRAEGRVDYAALLQYFKHGGVRIGAARAHPCTSSAKLKTDGLIEDEEHARMH